MDEIKVRWMRSKDLEEVLRIEKENFKFPWKKSYFDYDLRRPNTYCLVAEIDNKVVGYLIAWEIVDELHLANISVDRNYQKKGVGTKLINEIIVIARLREIKKIYLETRVSNIGAQKFYQKLGFKYSYLRKGYYNDGEDAWIMEKDL
ncbi:MAG: ribosomal protein S18-alanine N-acetyltransferase [candidate division WOR-3 bacterium]